MQKTKRDTWLDQYFFMNCIWLKNPFVTPFWNPTYLRLTIKVARWKPKVVSFIHYFLRAIWVQALLIFASFISKICIEYRKYWISYLSCHLFGQIWTELKISEILLKCPTFVGSFFFMGKRRTKLEWEKGQFWLQNVLFGSKYAKHNKNKVYWNNFILKLTTI